MHETRLSVIIVPFTCDNAINFLGILSPQTHKVRVPGTYTLGHVAAQQRNAAWQRANRGRSTTIQEQTETTSPLPK